MIAQSMTMRYNPIRRSLTVDNKIDSTGGGYITPFDPIATTLNCPVLQGEVRTEAYLTSAFDV